MWHETWVEIGVDNSPRKADTWWDDFFQPIRATDSWGVTGYKQGPTLFSVAKRLYKPRRRSLRPKKEQSHRLLWTNIQEKTAQEKTTQEKTTQAKTKQEKTTQAKATQEKTTQAKTT